MIKDEMVTVTLSSPDDVICNRRDDFMDYFISSHLSVVSWCNDIELKIPMIKDEMVTVITSSLDDIVCCVDNFLENFITAHLQFVSYFFALEEKICGGIEVCTLQAVDEFITLFGRFISEYFVCNTIWDFYLDVEAVVFSHLENSIGHINARILSKRRQYDPGGIILRLISLPVPYNKSLDDPPDWNMAIYLIYIRCVSNYGFMDLNLFKLLKLHRLLCICNSKILNTANGSLGFFFGLDGFFILSRLLTGMILDLSAFPMGFSLACNLKLFSTAAEFSVGTSIETVLF